jgi:hypothetical protein
MGDWEWELGSGDWGYWSGFPTLFLFDSASSALSVLCNVMPFYCGDEWRRGIVAGIMNQMLLLN